MIGTPLTVATGAETRHKHTPASDALSAHASDNVLSMFMFIPLCSSNFVLEMIMQRAS